MFSRKSLIKKTMQVGGSTLASRMLGLVREVLMAHYLGVDAVAESFITAFKIPNSLRKIFAEGALSISFIPTFVGLMRTKDVEQVNKLTTLGLILFEGALALICILVMWKAEWVIRVIAPGWYTSHEFVGYTTGISFIDQFFSTIRTWIYAQGPAEQVVYAVLFLRLLMGFILLLSTSALLSGAMQAVHHFFVPALSPVLLNIFFIAGLYICLHFKLFPTYLCAFIMTGGVVQLILHIVVYCKLGFALEKPDKKTWQHFKHVWVKFLPCLFSASVMEIFLFIDTSLATFLPTGSMALIYYANRFVQIPLSVVATALSTILLPQFSRVGSYAPKRLSFYLLESAKLVIWVTLPVMFLMWFTSEKIFTTLFLSKKFTLLHAQQAGVILTAFLIGLCFFSLNKILLNLFYALHETKLPMYISIIATLINGFLSYTLLSYWGAYGIAWATSISGIVQTALFLYFLHTRFGITLYVKPFAEFMLRYSLQLCMVGIFFSTSYGAFIWSIEYLPSVYQIFFLQKIGFWMWFMPLALLSFFILLKTNRLFKLKLYFLGS